MENESKYPLLEAIESPTDLRKLSPEQLPDVCREIRRYLIDTLSSHPGHFASSMGAVELTVALHYVFNTPYDRIVWDVGHQAYGHKILTGRFKTFGTLRQLGGISGFPNPAESEYDTCIAGHASNSISVALGMSIASALKDEHPRRNAVAVIGDASISGGLAFEGLNNAANSNSNLLIILNDNDMSIDRNVGSLNSYLAHLTTSKAYNNVRYKAYRGLKSLGMVSERGKHTILRFNNSLKSLISHEQNIFEGLNIRYFGPFDGHDVHNVVRILSDIKDMRGPKILHLRTIKGKGFKPAEEDPAAWHAPGYFDPTTGHKLNKDKKGDPPKFQNVMGETLVELATTNDKIVAITAAMLSGTSVSKMMDRYPARTFDVGISEGHAVTFSAGLASEGLVPFCAIYSSFLQRGYDQVIHDVAIRGLHVVFCIDRAGIVGEDGVTHHGIFDLAYLRNIPGMTLAAPRNEHQLRDLMYTAQLAASGPFAIRYPRGRGSIVDWRNEMRPIPIGKGCKLKEGSDVAVVTIGPIGNTALEVAKKAESDNRYSAAVYDLIFLKPVDESILHEIGLSGMPVVTVEDGVKDGGMGSAVLEWLQEHGYHNSVTRLGVPDKFISHGSVAELHAIAGIDAGSIDRALATASCHSSQQLSLER